MRKRLSARLSVALAGVFLALLPAGTAHAIDPSRITILPPPKVGDVVPGVGVIADHIVPGAGGLVAGPSAVV
ncbi:hypothetical protein [Streptomyces roseifaciens]|uniref:hypothetical protein n=1 Tax=Streptomyces roseifaciens TaxID=1488406 RepID=UPI000717DF87|nr:hypothetical protein [Streptomyces roseifaciens]